MINKITLIGNVGKDIELKETQSGNKFVKFTLATNEKDETIWHNIGMWGNNAENASKYVNKGDILYIEGKQVNGTYEKEGKKYYTSEVIAYSFRMLGGKKKGQNQDVPTPTEDDLPY